MENRMMLKRGPSTPEKQEYFHKLRDPVDPSRTDLTAWQDAEKVRQPVLFIWSVQSVWFVWLN
jgi:hypothetical protein